MKLYSYQDTFQLNKKGGGDDNDDDDLLLPGKER
jgi:hypothetical protein